VIFSRRNDNFHVVSVASRSFNGHRLWIYKCQADTSIQEMLTRDVTPTDDRRLHRCLADDVRYDRSFVHGSATKEIGGALLCRESVGECIKAAGYRAL